MNNNTCDSPQPQNLPITVRTPHQAAIWTAFAESIRPRVRERPSVWCANNLVMSSNLTQSPGRFNPQSRPWMRSLLDACYENPRKKGLIGVKPSQVRFSFTMISLLLCLAATDPGPMLYVTTTGDEADDFATRVMGGIVKDSPAIADLIRSGGDSRETLSHKEFAGGFIDFEGAGSERGLISKSRRFVFLDEFELASRLFPKTSGNLWNTALGRLPEYEDSSLLFAWSHPRYANEDIDQRWAKVSDQGAWVWDCPHCGKTIDPSWGCVRFLRTLGSGDDGAPDPASAVFICPHCGSQISDAERARAVWEPALGGTGRRESLLSPEEAEKRDYLGFKISRLSDGDVPLHTLAKEFCDCGTSEELQSFMNKRIGETFTRASGIVTFDMMQACIDAQEHVVVPDPPQGAHFVTGGVDVQGPDGANPTLYTTITAWTATGMALVTLMAKVRGWAALMDLLRNYSVRRVDGACMGVDACGIDCGAWSGLVLDACRNSVYSAASNARVHLVPMRFRDYMSSTPSFALWSVDKRIDRMRAHLGPFEHAYDLHRHSWVDRTQRRWQDGRIRVLCTPPEELQAHVAANVLMPKKDRHGWVSGNEMEWEKIKKASDDWNMALCYGEVTAALLRGLDRIHELVTIETPSPSGEERWQDREARKTERKGPVIERRKGPWVRGY